MESSTLSAGKGTEHELETKWGENREQAVQTAKRFVRLANYIGAAQLFLKDNFFLREPLKREHIKERLLGHWGTVPGINFIYSMCNYVIRKHDISMFLVTGPGHGAPANLACTFIEGSLTKFYQEYEHNEAGMSKLIKNFSWPGGFASHTDPKVPGSIYEGGELGYALSVSYGAVMDRPDLIVTCIVGDGEAETGPTATAWHSHKFIDPKQSGAVLPILHLNGFKIASSTLLATMPEEDLIKLFEGYGYQPRIVGGDRDRLNTIYEDMLETMEWALSEIRKIQRAAREDSPIFQPRWPMIILRTPKGWTGIKELDGMQIEGSCHAHQIPAKEARTNPAHLKALESWLSSYRVDELLEQDGSIAKDIIDFCPSGDRRMGSHPLTRANALQLNSPDFTKFMVDFSAKKIGEQLISSTTQAGHYLAELIKMNPDRFRIFSPDELESNKLTHVLSVTRRCYQWSQDMLQKTDGKSHQEGHQGAHGGNVIEVLSEHLCQGFMQGYSSLGGYVLLPTYEAFIAIITTMMQQHAKFRKISAECKWRHDLPSLNYIATSTHWRQEHNGFSHQNPSFLNSLINMRSPTVRVFLPPDVNCLIATLHHCMRSVNCINLIICSKQENPLWLDRKWAIRHCNAGISIWPWCSTDRGLRPDVVLCGCGTEMTAEVIAASLLLQSEIPELRIRVVNVTDLMVLSSEEDHPHGLSQTMFESIFTKDCPVVFSFHGYPSAVQQLLFKRKNVDRFKINGYQEEGTTTTPFRMLTCNGVSRFDVAIDALEAVAPRKEEVAIRAHNLIARFNHIIDSHYKYIVQYGKDPHEVQNVYPPKKNLYRFLHDVIRD